VTGLVLALALWANLPQMASALLAIGAGMLATGALHEDGLADTADGFGGGAQRDDKLAIMRDSRIGAFGVVALVVVIGLKSSALTAFYSPESAVAAMVGAGAVSRAAIPVFMNALTPARTDGLGFGAGRPAAGDAWAAAAIGAFFALFVGIKAWLIALVVCVLVGLVLIRIAKRQIGGYTGDVLGMVQAVVETTFLLVVAAIEI